MSKEVAMKKSPLISISYILIFLLIFANITGCGENKRHQPIKVTPNSSDNGGAGQTNEGIKLIAYSEVQPTLAKNCTGCHHQFDKDQASFDASVKSGEVLKRVWTKRDSPAVSMPQGDKASKISLEERQLIKDYALALTQPKLDDSVGNTPDGGTPSDPAPTPADPITETDQFKLISSCTSCHGVNGISTFDSVPNLAGLSDSYILSQLRAFKQVKINAAGQHEENKIDGYSEAPRKDAYKMFGYKMNTIVQNLGDAQMDLVVDFFSLSTATPPQNGTFPEGEKAEMVGKTAHCFGCHSGTVGAAGPPIKGQKSEYLANQIRAFKSGARTNLLMNGFAASINDTDIDKLTKYISTLKAN